MSKSGQFYGLHSNQIKSKTILTSTNFRNPEINICQLASVLSACLETRHTSWGCSLRRSYWYPPAHSHPPPFPCRVQVVKNGCSEIRGNVPPTRGWWEIARGCLSLLNLEPRWSAVSKWHRSGAADVLHTVLRDLFAGIFLFCAPCLKLLPEPGTASCKADGRSHTLPSDGVRSVYFVAERAAVSEVAAPQSPSLHQPCRTLPLPGLLEMPRPSMALRTHVRRVSGNFQLVQQPHSS